MTDLIITDADRRAAAAIIAEAQKHVNFLRNPEYRKIDIADILARIYASEREAAEKRVDHFAKQNLEWANACERLTEREAQWQAWLSEARLGYKCKDNGIIFKEYFENLLTTGPQPLR